jgi:RNA polymerase sigma factor (sigma-70 family)
MESRLNKAEVVGTQTHDLLRSYLQTKDHDLSVHLETQLLTEEVEPIIKSALRQRLRHGPLGSVHSTSYQSFEDVHSSAMLEVLVRLREMKRNANATVVANFKAYVAAITYRVWCDHLRKNSPLRAKLKRRLNYLLTRENGFALWRDGEDWLCGFASWEKQKPSNNNKRVRSLLEDPRCLERSQIPSTRAGANTLSEVVSSIFRFVEGPVRLNELVSTVSALVGTDFTTVNFDDNQRVGQQEIRDSHPTVEETIEHRIFLEYIWSEILELPLRQRSALLLNLTGPGGQSVIALLPVLGIASVDQIAEALALSGTQLMNLWNELPLDDETIGRQLGASRQQVINLRKTARERLVRRSRAFRGQ